MVARPFYLYSMKKILFILLLISQFSYGTVLYPGSTTDISFNPTTGEYSPTWTIDNPTIHLSSVGFLCHVTAQAYFGGTATLTCTYKERIGSTVNTLTRRWSFTCIDTKISISPTSKDIKVGESFQISWSFDKTTYIAPLLQFNGYDSNIISVTSDGYVKAKKEGTTNIYVKSDLGTNTAVCSVTVTEQGSSGESSKLSGYYDWNYPNARIVTLSEPGTISNFISESEKNTIKNLTVIGPLNGKDLRFLREMAGADCNKVETQGKLETLDLKDAVFVSGGPWYIQQNNYDDFYYTKDDPEFPEYAFFYCHSIKNVRLPKYCTSGLNTAFNYCKNITNISVPPGTTTFSIYGGYWTQPISSIILPSSTERLSLEWNKMTNIYCYAETPPVIGINSHTNIKNGILYVPKGCSQSYWSAKGWRDFGDIKETLELCKTLSVRVGENGSLKYKGVTVSQNYPRVYSGYSSFDVPVTENIEIEILPDEGYYIDKITLDNKDITIPNNSTLLSLGNIKKHSLLTVSFSMLSAINTIQAENNVVYIYNLQGIFVGILKNKTDISKYPKGCYILKQGKKSVLIRN